MKNIYVFIVLILCISCNNNVDYITEEVNPTTRAERRALYLDGVGRTLIARADCNSGNLNVTGPISGSDSSEGYGPLSVEISSALPGTYNVSFKCHCGYHVSESKSLTIRNDGSFSIGPPQCEHTYSPFINFYDACITKLNSNFATYRLRINIDERRDYLLYSRRIDEKNYQWVSDWLVLQPTGLFETDILLTNFNYNAYYPLEYEFRVVDRECKNSTGCTHYWRTTFTIDHNNPNAFPIYLKHTEVKGLW